MPLKKIKQPKVKKLKSKSQPKVKVSQKQNISIRINTNGKLQERAIENYRTSPITTYPLFREQYDIAPISYNQPVIQPVKTNPIVVEKTDIPEVVIPKKSRTKPFIEKPNEYDFQSDIDYIPPQTPMIKRKKLTPLRKTPEYSKEQEDFNENYDLFKSHIDKVSNSNKDIVSENNVLIPVKTTRFSKLSNMFQSSSIPNSMRFFSNKTEEYNENVNESTENVNESTENNQLAVILPIKKKYDRQRYMNRAQTQIDFEKANAKLNRNLKKSQMSDSQKLIARKEFREQYNTK